MKLETKKLGPKWWIIGDEECGPIGPYESKAAAEEDRIGLSRFHRHHNKPGFITSESRKIDE
jgi:hypothetical protein